MHLRNWKIDTFILLSSMVAGLATFTVLHYVLKFKNEIWQGAIAGAALLIGILMGKIIQGLALLYKKMRPIIYDNRDNLINAENFTVIEKNFTVVAATDTALVDYKQKNLPKILARKLPEIKAIFNLADDFNLTEDSCDDELKNIDKWTAHWGINSRNQPVMVLKHKDHGLYVRCKKVQEGHILERYKGAVYNERIDSHNFVFLQNTYINNSNKDVKILEYLHASVTSDKMLIPRYQINEQGECRNAKYKMPRNIPSKILLKEILCELSPFERDQPVCWLVSK